MSTTVESDEKEKSSLAKSNSNDESTAVAAQKARERQERFKSLQARQAQSRKQNLKDSAAESHRLSTNHEMLAALNRKRDIATHKLIKANVEASGEDFERKRAWDWTVDESEKWDRRMAKKERHRQDVMFQDYTQEARKTYKRQMRQFQPDLEAYERQKVEAVQRSARSGGLEIVETEDGELIAVDKDGTFYSTADSTDFTQNKPGKEAVDRLVNDIRKAEEARLKKRRERGNAEEDGDITYINEKVTALLKLITCGLRMLIHLQNKQFNEKLARFYNKVRNHLQMLLASLTQPYSILRMCATVLKEGLRYKQRHRYKCHPEAFSDIEIYKTRCAVTPQRGQKINWLDNSICSHISESARK